MAILCYHGIIFMDSSMDISKNTFFVLFLGVGVALYSDQILQT